MGIQGKIIFFSYLFCPKGNLVFYVCKKRFLPIKEWSSRGEVLLGEHFSKSRYFIYTILHLWYHSHRERRVKYFYWKSHIFLASGQKHVLDATWTFIASIKRRIATSTVIQPAVYSSATEFFRSYPVLPILSFFVPLRSPWKGWINSFNWNFSDTEQPAMVTEHSISTYRIVNLKNIA